MRYIFCKHCNEKIELPDKYIEEIECNNCAYVNDLLYDMELYIFFEEAKSLLYQSISDDLIKIDRLLERIKSENKNMGEFSFAIEKQINSAQVKLHTAEKLVGIKKRNYLVEEKKNNVNNT